MQRILMSAVFLLALWPAMSSAREYTVRVVSDYENLHMKFEPNILAIRPGDTVIWVNEADEIHNMVTYPDGYPQGAEGFNSPFLEEAGQTWSHTFSDEGTYEYHCVPHIMMGMRGRVIVGTATTPDHMNKPSAGEVKIYRDRLLEYFDTSDIEKMPDYLRVLRRQANEQ